MGTASLLSFKRVRNVRDASIQDWPRSTRKVLARDPQGSAARFSLDRLDSNRPKRKIARICRHARFAGYLWLEPDARTDLPWEYSALGPKFVSFMQQIALVAQDSPVSRGKSDRLLAVGQMKPPTLGTQAPQAQLRDSLTTTTGGFAPGGDYLVKRMRSF